MVSKSSIMAKDGTKVDIRVGKPEDYDTGINTWAAVAAEKVYLNSESIRPDIKQRWIERYAENGKDVLLALASVNDLIVGGAILTKYSESPKTEHVRELGMWIVKEHRGNGIGKLLLDYAISWAKAHGNIRKILLGVWSTNKIAMSLYLKSGFYIEGTHTKVAKIVDSYVDEILMCLDL